MKLRSNEWFIHGPMMVRWLAPGYLGGAGEPALAPTWAPSLILLLTILLVGCTTGTQPGPWSALPPHLELAQGPNDPGSTYIATRPFAVTRDLCFGYVVHLRRPSGACDPAVGCDQEASHEIDLTSVYALAELATLETCEALFREGMTITVAGMTDPTYVSLFVNALGSFLKTSDAAVLGMPEDAGVQDLLSIDSTVIDRSAHVGFRMVDPEARESGRKGYVLEARFDLTTLSDVKIKYRFLEDMLLPPVKDAPWE